MSHHVTPSPAAPFGESGATPYRDKRSDFFQLYFNRGERYDDYIAQGEPRHRERWIEYSKRIALGADDRRIIATFTRKINFLVLSGIWCGDCVRQGPMLRAIELESPLLEFRYLDNKAFPELQEELRINGAEKVPVIVALSEDFFEIQRFGDRHLSVYRRKAQSELGPACDSGISPSLATELAVEVSEWVLWLERLQLVLRLSPMLRRRYQD